MAKLLNLLPHLMVLSSSLCAKASPTIQGDLDRLTAEYPAAERATRLEVFALNAALAAEHNLRANTTYTLGVTSFSHLTQREFAAAYLHPLSPGVFRRNQDTFQPSAASPPETEVNWVTKGVVTRVYEQGQCAACWAFSASGALEGAFAIKTGKLTALSQQQIIECDHSKVDNGCHGTWTGMDSAFDFLASNDGLCDYASYPYTGANSSDWTTCHQKENGCVNVGGSAPTNHTDVAQSEAALLAAVAQQPVSVVIDASCPGFMLYTGGVWSMDCGTKLDHAVLVVGYGSDNGKDYWLVKNSWGESWGESGYVRLERGLAGAGGHGICDIASTAAFPTI